MIPPSPAGFRRSMRLCRRKSHLSQRRAGACCAGSCCSAVGAPYEEVTRYQRRPSDKHRLIVLVGTWVRRGGRCLGSLSRSSSSRFNSLSLGAVVKAELFYEMPYKHILKKESLFYLCVFINKTSLFHAFSSTIECDMPLCI